MIRSGRTRATRRFAARVVSKVLHATGVRCDVWIKPGQVLLRATSGTDWKVFDSIVNRRHGCMWASDMTTPVWCSKHGFHRVFGLPGAAWPHISAHH